MADNTKIEWTDATWTPITGCSVVSPGCTNCYAMRLAGTRMKHHPSRAGLTSPSRAGPVWNGQVRLNEDWLSQPFRWRKPRRIFVCAHGDLFHENVPEEWIDRVFAVMALCPQHTFQVLTKRAQRMREYFTQMGPCRISDVMHEMDHPFDEDWTQMAADRLDLITMPRPLHNVWLGVSVEDQRRADERIPALLDTPASVRFISAEPLLGPVNIAKPQFGAGWCAKWCKHDCQAWGDEECPKSAGAIDWVIVGGESGPNARPMHPDWARSLRDQCQEAGVAFHFKQWGEWVPWEPAMPPFWLAQNGSLEDGNTLFPQNMDDDPNWDDGLNQYDPAETDHAPFQRVGKRAAGRLLDGREWNEVPE